MSETDQIGTDQDAPVEDGTGQRRNRWPRVLIAVACLIGLVATLNTWLERQVLDTDSWVETTDRLLADDDIRSALAAYLVDELYASVPVDESIEEVLPEDFAGLAPLLAGALRGPATDAVDGLLATDAVRELWSQANREAHSLLVAVIEDDTGEVLSSAEGTVSIDLGALVRALGERIGLGDDLLDRIPEGAGVVVLFESEELEVVQDVAKGVRLLSVLLFLLVVGLFIAAVYFDTDRRRAVRDVGIGIVVVALLVLIARRFGVDALVANLRRATDDEPARSVLVVGTELLRQAALTQLLAGVALIAFAVSAGPSRVGRGVRAFFSPLLRYGWWSAIGGGLVVLIALLWLSPSGPVRGPGIAIGLTLLCVGGVVWIQRLAVAEYPDMTFAELGQRASASVRRPTGGRGDGAGSTGGDG